MTIWVWVVLATTPISLPEVRELSRRQNSAAALAEISFHNADEQVRGARAAIFPQLFLSSTASGFASGPQRVFTTVPASDGNGGVTFVQQSVDVPGNSRGQFDTSLNFSQLLYDGGKWWNTIAQAGASSRAAEDQLEEQRIQSEFEGVRRYYELYRAQKSYEVLVANARRSDELLARANAMFEAGRLQKADVFAAKVNLGNDRISVIKQKAQIAGAQADLAIWVGRPGTDEYLALEPEELKAAPAPVPAIEVAATTAREHRPLLKALGSQIQAADLGVDLARSGFLPRISAGASLGRSGPSIDPVYTDLRKQNYVSGTLQLRWDLFSGFATDSLMKQAHYAQAQAAVNLAEATREVEGDVHRSLSALESQIAAARIATDNREAASQGLGLSEERFKAGAGSTLEVRDAQLKLTQSELSLLSTRIDAEIARANVARVLGGSGVLP